MSNSPQAKAPIDDATAFQDAGKFWKDLDAVDLGQKTLDEVLSTHTTENSGDTLEGGSGNDTIPAEENTDTLEGGSGDDTVSAAPTYQELMDKVSGLEAKLGQADKRLYNVEGHIGGLNASVKRVQEEFKGRGKETPSAEQIAKAQVSPEAMAELEEKYPAFAKVIKPVLEDAVARMTPASQQAAQQIPDDIVTEKDFREWQNRQYVELRHEGWEEKVKTPEFYGWLTRQPREVQMLATSDNPKDAVRLLDLHADAAKPPQKQSTDNDQLASHAALPGGKRGGGPTTKRVEDMTPGEYWRYLDEQDRLKAKQQR